MREVTVSVQLLWQLGPNIVIEAGNKVDHRIPRRPKSSHSRDEIASQHRDEIRLSPRKTGQLVDTPHDLLVDRVAQLSIIRHSIDVSVEHVNRAIGKHEGILDSEVHSAGRDRSMNVRCISCQRHAANDFMRRDPIIDVK